MELTKAEFQVCAYTAAGYEPKETANLLFRSYHTIACHIKHIRVKNGLRNVAELTMHFVLENGDPRRFIAIIFFTLHVGSIYNESNIRNKIPRRSKVSKQSNSKRSKTREYYT